MKYLWDRKINFRFIFLPRVKAFSGFGGSFFGSSSKKSSS